MKKLTEKHTKDYEIYGAIPADRAQLVTLCIELWIRLGYFGCRIHPEQMTGDYDIVAGFDHFGGCEVYKLVLKDKPNETDEHKI